MSGIGIAVAGGKSTSVPPPPEFELQFSWNGTVPVNVTSASGTTNVPNYFLRVISGGTPPYTTSFTVTYNPSGKLTLFALGSQTGVAWNGMTINEAEGISVRCDAADSAGNSRSASDSCIIRRTS